MGRGADHVVLVDAGPWGEAWEVIFDAERRAVLVATIRGWGRPDPSWWWKNLRDRGRPEDAIERVASWLWLQGRSANNSPVWWQPDDRPVMARGNGLDNRGPIEGWGRLVMPEKCNRGTPLKDAVERSTRTRSSSRHASSGVARPSTVADRIEAIGRAPWRQVTVLRSHAELDALGLDVDVEYMDPPYQGCTRYAAVCPRDEVLRMATAARDRGARVVVSEACALPLEGWHALQIGRREWLTCSERPMLDARAVQLTMYRCAG